MDGHYRKLGIAMGINTVVMFLLTYVMIDRLDHFYVNINRIYMAVLMAAPMGIVMLLVMRGMYTNGRLNAILLAGFAGMFVLMFAFIRTQTPVGNGQFLRSMIPHHSGAIVMCRESALTDPEIMKLCEQIVKAQEEEIAQMTTMLSQY